MTFCCLTEQLAMSKSNSTKLSAKLKSCIPLHPSQSHPHLTPVLSLDIPSPCLLSSHTSSSFDFTGEDVDLNLLEDTPDLPHRPISPWVDLGQRSSHPSNLLLSPHDRLTDAGRRRTQYVSFTPLQLSQILNLAAPIIRERGLETLGLFRPWRFSESPFQIARLQLLLIDYLLPSPPSSLPDRQPSRPVSLDDIRDQMVFTLVHDLVHVLKWSIRHLSYHPSHFALSSSWYTTFTQLEREKSFPQNAYVSILLPLLPLSTQQLLTPLLDLVAAVAAHADQNAMPASYLCKLLGFWILGLGSDSFVSYEQLYFEWDRAGRAFEHVFLAYLRSQTSKLPKRLKELISLYPTGSTQHAPFSSKFTTKSIRVLKVQIETSSLSEPLQKPDQPELALHQEHFRLASPTPSSTIRRGPSTRSRTKPGSRRSVSISTVRPTSLPPPLLPPKHRNTLEILKSAFLAHPAPDLSSTHYPLWKSLLDSARAEDRHQLLLASSSLTSPDFSAVKDVIGLLDDETLRVISLTQLPVAPSPTDHHHALMRNRPRSFSLDVSSSAPPHTNPATPAAAVAGTAHLLATLHEDHHHHPTISSLLAPSSIAPSIASNRAAPTASWADFVASGFAPSATSAPVLSPPGSALGHDVPATAVIASRTSCSTVRSAPATTLTPKRSRTGHHKHKPPVTRSQRPVRLVPDELAGSAAPVTLVTEQQPERTLKSINLVCVDESFPDVWIDTVGEPMILARWPSFFISPIVLPTPKPIGENLSDQPEGFASSTSYQAGGRDTASMPSHLLVDEVLIGRHGFDPSHQPYQPGQIARDLPSVTPNDRGELAFVQILPGQDSELRLQGQLPSSSNDNNVEQVSHAQSSSEPIPSSTSAGLAAAAAAKSNKMILIFSTLGRNSKRKISSFFANYQSVLRVAADDDEHPNIVKKKKKKKDKKWLGGFPILREGSGLRSATEVKAPAAAPAVAVVDQEESGNTRKETKHEAQLTAAVSNEGPSQPQLDEVSEATAGQRRSEEAEEPTVVVVGKRETGDGEIVAPGNALTDSNPAAATEQPSELLLAGEEKVKLEGSHDNTPMMENSSGTISNRLQDEQGAGGDHHVVKKSDDGDDDDEGEIGGRLPTPLDISMMIDAVDTTAQQSADSEEPSLLQQREQQQQEVPDPVKGPDLVHDDQADDNAQRLLGIIASTSGFREHLDLETNTGRQGSAIIEGASGDIQKSSGEKTSHEKEDEKKDHSGHHQVHDQVDQEKANDVEQESVDKNVEEQAIRSSGGVVEFSLPIDSVADDHDDKNEAIDQNDAKITTLNDDQSLNNMEWVNHSKKEEEVVKFESQDLRSLPLNPTLVEEEQVQNLSISGAEEAKVKDNDDDPQLGQAPEVVNEGLATENIGPVASTCEVTERSLEGADTAKVDSNVNNVNALGGEVPVTTMSVDVPTIVVGSDPKALVEHDSTAVPSKQDSKANIGSLSSTNFAKSNGSEGDEVTSPQRTWRTHSSASQASKTSTGDPASPVSSTRRSILSKASIKLKNFSSSRSRKGSSESATTNGTIGTTSIPVVTTSSGLETTAEEDTLHHGHHESPQGLSSTNLSVKGSDDNIG